jgi:hypothetical protein
MAKMRIYTVHINPRSKHPYENPIFIGESFNFFAFFFHWMWALYHRLWLVAVLLLPVWMLIEWQGYNHILHPLANVALVMGFQAFCGFQANDWRRTKLKKQGYIISDIVTGDNLVSAEQRYFERYYPEGRLPQLPPKTPATTPA